jgi:hypothetical protein
MNSKLGATLLALPLLMGTTLAMACDQQAASDGPPSPLLSEALDELRAERARQMQLSARAALAQLRSETETALAQGASTPAGPSVKTGP